MVNTKINLIVFFAAKDGEALYNQQKQDQEQIVAQIMNSLLPNSDLEKVGKSTRLFRYDLNQIPYNYTVEVTNEFKWLDLIRVPKELKELQMKVCNTVQGNLTNIWEKKWKAKKKKKDTSTWMQSSNG